MSTTVSYPGAGHLVDGRYRIVSRLAQGGMGVVYLALDNRLDRTVALKIMHPGLADDDFVRRFIGEAKAAAQLSHPGVVGVYDQGRDAGLVFLAMEYVPGRTLRDLLRERGRLGPHEALTIMDAVLSALGAAHRAGLIHRDVKPENVLLADDGRVKVADFGLARAIAASNHTRTSGLILGTVGYLSPEQVEHGTADPRSDVYAAGVMLFELLTGRPPFEGETPLAVAYKHVNDLVPAPSSLVPDLPPALDVLVARATNREPARRPADANELLGAVHQARQLVPPTAAGPAPPSAPDSDASTEVIRRDSHDTLLAPRSPVPAPAPATGPPPAPGRLGPLGLRRSVLAGALALAVLLGAGGLGFAVLMTEAPGGFAGMTVRAATHRAEQLGFQVDVGPARFSDEVPRNHVISTDPHPGGRIRKGGTITLVPSKGPRVVGVPKLGGRPLGEATERLEKVGLRVGEVSRDYSVTVPKGEVIRTEPPAGERLRQGSAVDLVLSRGIEVPDLRGWLLDEAEKELRKHGFDVDITERFSEDHPKGEVIAQRPARGGVRKGSTIELTASKGPPLVAVPDVVGKNANQAAKQLRDAGFEVQVHRGFGNHVRMQLPRGGQQAPKGSTVTILVF